MAKNGIISMAHVAENEPNWLVFQQPLFAVFLFCKRDRQTDKPSLSVEMIHLKKPVEWIDWNAVITLPLQKVNGSSLNYRQYFS